MGQRHQVFLRIPGRHLPDAMGKPNPNNYDAQTLGVHHQWCYGRKALLLLARTLMFITVSLRDDSYSPIAIGGFKEGLYGWVGGEVSDILAALYSVMPEEGYYHRTHNLAREVIRQRADPKWNKEWDDRPWNQVLLRSPEGQDNDDGITIIDAEALDAVGRPRYAFSRLYGNFEPDGEAGFSGVAWGAEEYLSFYYPRNKWGNEEIRAVGALAPFEVLKPERILDIFPEWHEAQAAIKAGE